MAYSARAVLKTSFCGSCVRSSAGQWDCPRWQAADWPKVLIEAEQIKLDADYADFLNHEGAEARRNTKNFNHGFARIYTEYF